MPPFVFWYVYASNGTDGFLLDLIRRPEGAMARLAVYRLGSPPGIVRRGFRLEELYGAPGELGVRLSGGIALDALGCRAVAGDIALDARFRLSGRAMRFVPSWVVALFGRVPDFRSHYGTLERAACQGTALADSPLVYSTYSVTDLAGARWVLISAHRFADSDLALEISAARLLDRWVSTAWVSWGGREYKLNAILDSLLHVRVATAGEIENGERVFRASIRKGELAIEIEGRAVTGQFACLDVEGDTQIQTTLFGTCRASVAPAGKTFIAERTCLLEVKN